MAFPDLGFEMNEAHPVGYAGVNQVPRESGIYSAWLDDEPQCFYVGKSSSLSSRIRSHFSGQRGSDQFCLYVYDKYVHPKRCATNNQLTTPEVNKLTGKWIKEHIRFRWIELDWEECTLAEQALRHLWNPTLNPL